MATRERSAFGSLLRSYRIEAGFSQERLAKHAGLSERGISKLERGERKSPHLETVRMLADALGLGAEDRIPLLRAARPSENGARAKDAAPEPAQSILPVPPTPLVGREHETFAVVELLGGDATRLITLTGTGGVGKTRLALEIATRASTAFPDGACFVALASVSNHALVASAMADAIGVRISPGVSAQTELRRYLRSRNLLLVLDNFEHVLPAALEVADLLATCSGLKVLATSRIPLRLRGEHQVPISPLGMPGSDRTLADVAGSDAVRLFVARAQEVKPEFALNDDNAATIVEICRSLDGLPLALELAAVRIKVLTPDALLKRLERRLTLLTGGAQDLPARHQTLRATIAWSYDLLSPDEQALFRRLAVFAGGWTLDAAETVVAPDGTLDLFEGLASLMNASLVQSVDGSGGERRYLMLETVREFAAEQLEASGEAETLGRRHADWCIALADQVDTDLSDAASERLEARLEAEQANIRAALGWLRDSELSQDGLRLATAMGGFWGPRSAHAEGGGWMETFLAQPGTTELPAADRIRALWWLGQWAAYRGDLTSAQDLLGQSLALAQQVGDKRGIAMGLGAVAMAMVHHGGVAKSIAILEEAIALAREVGNRRDLSDLLTYLAVAHGHTGDLARAEALAAESLELVRSFGATRGFETTMAMLFMGWIAYMRDDLDLAAERFGQALAFSRALASKAIQSAALSGLGEVALARGRNDEAAAHFREGLVMGWESNLPSGMVFNLPGMVRLAIMHGDTRRAARMAGVLETFGSTLESMPAVCVRRFRADVERLQSALGEEAFAAELHQGKALGPAEIVADALALDEAGVTPRSA